MPVRIVQSQQNERVKQLRRALTRPERDQVGIEGPHLVAEAVRAGLKIHCAFVAEGSERLLQETGLLPETDTLVVPRSLLASALATETPQMVAALVAPRAWAWTDLLQPAGGQSPLLVVLAGLQDPGNLGTIIRSAEAFGATGVVSLPGTASEWNPKAVRASAGSVFRVPMIAANADEAFSRLHAAGVRALTAAADAATPAQNAEFSAPTALLIGNEGNGVPANIAAQADGAIAIPCPGPVESLNAAVAASVLLYEAARQRSSAGTKPQTRSRGAR